MYVQNPGNLGCIMNPQTTLGQGFRSRAMVNPSGEGQWLDGAFADPSMPLGAHVHSNLFIKANATFCIKVCTPTDVMKIVNAAAILLQHQT